MRKNELYKLCARHASEHNDMLIKLVIIESSFEHQFIY